MWLLESDWSTQYLSNPKFVTPHSMDGMQARQGKSRRFGLDQQMSGVSDTQRRPIEGHATHPSKSSDYTVDTTDVIELDKAFPGWPLYYCHMNV